MYLITGATGFIGTALCRRLSQEGRAYRAISRTTSGSNVNEMAFDLEQENVFSAALKDVDVVIHLAGRAHQLSEKSADPLALYRKINRDATLALARQAAEAKVKRFVFVSSIGVNGNASTKPFLETDTENPHDLYAISKYEAELGLMALAARSDIEIVIVRPPLVYGPDAPGNFARLLKLVRTGLPLPFGAIDNKRSFIYVDNLVDALLLCATHENSVNKKFLVSDGEDVSTPELIRLMSTVAGRPNRVITVPLALLKFPLKLIGKEKILDKLAESLQIDSSKIRNELGWDPPVSFIAGLNKTLGNGS